MNRLSFRSDGNRDEFSWGLNKSREVGIAKIYRANTPEYSVILPKRKDPQNKERIGSIMIRTLGTSRSIQEELIASFESILPRVVDNLLAKNTELGYVNKSQLNDRLISFAKRSSMDVLKSLTPEELERRIEKILILESTISVFRELTPDQRKIIDELIER
jgi:hypothetical protein